MFNLRLEGKAPVYEQLYKGIVRLISTGELVSDEKLPAVREVAKQLGINPNTVQKSYALLEQAGFIYSIPAKGSYVSVGKIDDAIKAEALKTVRKSLAGAFESGVSKSEILECVEEIWADGRGVI